MKFTSVKPYKGSTYEAVLDDERRIYLHIDIITDFGIHSGMECDRAQLKKIIYASNFRRAYQFALHCLDYRDYSAKEMTRKLTDTYKNPDLCSAVVRKLIDNSIIDDARFAEKLARKFVESRKFGYRRAKREIIMKGIDEFTADDALAVYDSAFADNLMLLLESKHSRLLTDSSDKKSVEKVKCALVRYGYGFDEINQAIRLFFENADTPEE